MASLRKRGEKWQARVHRKDRGDWVQSFSSKADAIKWARHMEAQLDLGVLAARQAMPTLKLMVERYAKEVTPTKKGRAQEACRAAQMKRSSLAGLPLDRIDGAAVVKYRDQRLTEVANNTVRLELAFLSVVFEQCRLEWGYKVVNPVREIRMPKPGKPRQRRLEAGEEDALLTACRASGAHYLETLVVLAIETGMRFGELCGVQWEQVNFSHRTIHLPDTKNGHARTVPLSTRALGAVHSLPRSISGALFAAKPGSILLTPTEN